MKMMSMKMMAMMLGMGVMGYMYLKKHSEKGQKIKEMGNNMK